MTSMPSLNSLRVFESVARVGHLSAAAAELHITIGAVSHHLRSIQDQIGVRLFEKRGRRLVLTQRGKILQHAVADALAGIGSGIREIASNGENIAKQAVLHISLPPVLAQTWLSGRLFRFLSDYPHIHLRAASAIEFVAIDWRNTDVAIVYGNPPWPGFWWRMLHGIQLTPVCSPQLLRGPNAIRNPSDVVFHRLLHEDDGSEWRRWLAQARVPYPGEPDVYFKDFGMMMQAARDGHGVALVDDVIAARDLDEGKLVQPIALSVPAAKNYHCICIEENLNNPAIGRFVDWLIAESEAERKQPGVRNEQTSLFQEMPR